MVSEQPSITAAVRPTAESGPYCSISWLPTARAPDPLTGRTWMLGTSMKIRVAAADVALGRIDFEYMVE